LFQNSCHWLKNDFALGHGHANAVAAVLLKSDSRKASGDEKLRALFSGKKAHWLEASETLLARIKAFGGDVEIAPNETHVNILCGKKKFAILQASSSERLDVGIKLKGAPSEGRLETAGSWNNMVTHRVRVADSSELDDELLGWLRRAYDAS
jgi:hypothetical protein